jgi:hypothetical protein
MAPNFCIRKFLFGDGHLTIVRSITLFNLEPYSTSGETASDFFLISYSDSFTTYILEEKIIVSFFWDGFLAFDELHHLLV